jgi:hypothetical protein
LLAAKIVEVPTQLRGSLRGSAAPTRTPTVFLRQYLPRKSRFADRTQDELDAIAAELDGRPRKTLDFRTLAQALETVLP